MKKFWGVSLLVLCMPTFALGASGYATQKGCTFTFSANGKTEQLENIGRATFYSGLSDLWYANGESVPGANLNGLFTWGNLKSINGKSVNKSLADGAESVSFNCDKTSQNNGFAVTCGDIDGSVGQTSLGGRYFARCVKKTYKVPESVKKELKNPNAPSKSQASSSSIDSFIFQYKQKDKNSGDWQENVFNVAKAIFDTSASRYFDDRDQPLRGIPDAMYLQKIDNKSVNIAKEPTECFMPDAIKIYRAAKNWAQSNCLANVILYLINALSPPPKSQRNLKSPLKSQQNCLDAN